MNSEKISPFMEGKSIPICSYSDDNYAPFLGITIFSVIENCDRTNFYDILLLSNDISEKNKNRIFDLASDKPWISIRFVDCTKVIQQLNVEKNTSYTINTYLRLMVFTELFSEYNRLITIDSDMIVKSDLAELYKIDLKGYPIAAVKDTYIKYIVDKKLHGDRIIRYQPISSYFFTIGIDLQRYFNAGTLLIDLAEAREKHIFDKINTICNQIPALMYADQDILNLIYQSRYLELPLEWNGMSPYALMTGAARVAGHELPHDYIQAVSDAKILHYIGIRKPWQDRNSLYIDQYIYYARRTIWNQYIVDTQKKWEQRQNEKEKNLFDSLFPIGSKRRKYILRYSYWINDTVHGWR